MQGTETPPDLHPGVFSRWKPDGFDGADDGLADGICECLAGGTRTTRSLDQRPWRVSSERPVAWYRTYVSGGESGFLSFLRRCL